MTASFIADSYTRADAIMDEIVERVSAFITEGNKAAANIAKVRDGLDQLDNASPAGYLETVQFIKAQVAANPGDAAWAAMDAKLDKVIADFQAAKTRFTTMAAAIDGM